MIPRRGLRLTTFRGIGIFLHWSWFIAFVLLFLVVLQFFQANLDSKPHVYVPLSLATTLLFFLSVLLHELSHSLVANRNGVPINRITLFVFGGVAQMGSEVTSPGVEFKMAVSGPLCSYLLCLLFGSLAYLFYAVRLEAVSFGFMLLAAVNFGLGTFNLIPGFPLDGGRILRSLLWHHWKDMEKSTRYASRLGMGVGGIMALSGLGMLLADLFQNQYDLLFAGTWFVLIGTFLVQAASRGYRQVRLRTSLAGSRVADLMHPEVSGVDLSSSLEEVFRLHLELSPASTVPVLGQGRLVGSVTLSDLRKVERSRWEDTPVSEVVRPLNSDEVCSPSLPIFEALAILEGGGGGFLWVADKGRLVGVLLREDVESFLRQAMRSGR